MTDITPQPLAVQQAMTLAAVAYLDESKIFHPRTDLKQMRTDMNTMLQDTNLATNNDWAIVWGPARIEKSKGDNLAYIAKNSQDGTLALVLRGTVANSFDSWKEDLPTELVAFGTDGWGSVCKEFYDAVHGLLTTTDVYPGDPTLDAYITSNQAATWWVSGHSQGGGLVPLMQATLATTYGIAAVSGYSFAGPSCGDPTFAAKVDADLTLTRVINLLDIVPRAYNQLSTIWTDNIPCESLQTLEIRGAVDLWTYETELRETDFAQPMQHVIALPKVPVPDPDTDYWTQVEDQHATSSYLYLMGAKSVRGTSPLIPSS